MKHLTQILLENGWKPHRYKWNGKEWAYEPCEFTNHYSSIESGNIDYRFLKDGNEVVWGLNERWKPPTLTSPVRGFIGSWCTDDDVIKYLDSKPHEEVYNDLVKYFSQKK